MTWQEVQPPRRGKGASVEGRAPVRVSLAAYGKDSSGWRIVVTFRADAMAEVPWLRPGMPVAVLHGAGEHAGKLRLENRKGGRYTLQARSGGKCRDGQHKRICALSLPVLDGIERVVRAPVAVEYDYLDDWLEVDLPGWAMVAVPHISAAPIAVPKPRTVLVDKVLGGRATAPAWTPQASGR